MPADRPLPTTTRHHDPDPWFYWAEQLRRRGLRPGIVELVWATSDPKLLADLVRGTDTRTRVEALNVLWDLQETTMVGKARVLHRLVRQLRGHLWQTISPPLAAACDWLVKVPGLRPRGR